MPFIDFQTGHEHTIWDGIHGRMHHSEQLTFGHFRIDAGAILPAHSHPHEQWTHVVEGELEFTIDGEITVLKPGMAAFIPSNAEHSARALTACRVIDCFDPVREDFRALDQ